MRRVVLSMLVGLLLVAPSAFALTSTSGSCVFTWNESPPPTVPMQYYLYTRREAERYRFAVLPPAGGAPLASAENRTGIVEQRLPCERVVLAGDGRSYLVVTAVALDGSEESAPSNELWIDVQGGRVVAWGIVDEGQPPSPPPPAPTPPIIPVAPKPPITTPDDVKPPPAFVVIPPMPPPSAGGSPNLVDSCLWNSCQPSPLPRTMPPGFGQGSPSLGDSSIWNGTRR